MRARLAQYYIKPKFKYLVREFKILRLSVFFTKIGVKNVKSKTNRKYYLY